MMMQLTKFAVAVVDDKAYIIGGWSHWTTGGDNYTGPNDYLRVIDFSKSVRTSMPLLCLPLF
jgi:hypothetical protein